MSKRHRTARLSAAPAPSDALPAAVRLPRATPFPRRKPRTVGQELACLGRARESLVVRELAAVVAARSQGLPWHQIASLLGLPLASVHRRYRDSDAA